jgi:hypothetical protein
VIDEQQYGSTDRQAQLCLYYFILATCFGFSGKPSSGNKKNTQRKTFKYNPLKGYSFK